jgi:hypothetical protein
MCAVISNFDDNDNNNKCKGKGEKMKIIKINERIKMNCYVWN